MAGYPALDIKKVGYPVPSWNIFYCVNDDNSFIIHNKGGRKKSSVFSGPATKRGGGGRAWPLRKKNF